MATPLDLQAIWLASDTRTLEAQPTIDEVVDDASSDDGDTTGARGGRTLVIESGHASAPNAAHLVVAGVELAFGAGPAGLDLDFPAAFAPAPAAADLDEPQTNGSGGTVATVDNDWRFDGQLSGFKWAQSAITYSDPNSTSDYQNSYPQPLSDFAQISAAQLRAVHAALDTAVLGQPAGGVGFSVEGFTNLGVSYVGPGSGAGTIRLANTSDYATAYAYGPSASVDGGDVFFGGSGRSPVVGNRDHHSVLHELGKALGLNALDVSSIEYSVMSSLSFYGDSLDEGFPNEEFGFAQTFMMSDIAALQYLYGADFTTNAGDTTYSWDPLTGQSFVNGVVALTPGANRIFQTIWDGGGSDTYDLSNYNTNLRISIEPGRSSTFSAEQLAYLGDGLYTDYASGNVFNALQYQDNDYQTDDRSLIENVRGGSGNDQIEGNFATNIIYGGEGNDNISGGPEYGQPIAEDFDGNDILYGGSGDDWLFGGAGSNTLYGGDGNDYLSDGTLYGGNGDDSYIWGNGIELQGDAIGGVDTVYTPDFHTLSANMENLVLTASYWDDYYHDQVDGNGNSRDNVINGNGIRNVLRGLGGSDIIDGEDGSDDIYGGDGTDTLYGGDSYNGPEYSSDIIYGGTQADQLFGRDGDDRLHGDDGDDMLFGEDGNDTLFGGLNDDQLYGGLGNDIYNTNSALDTVFETVGGAAGGVDLVNAYANFTLGANFEKLAMTGVGTVGTGNSLNNVITGQGSAETLSGLGGNDVIFGGGGNDVVDGGTGIDTVYGDTGDDIVRGGDGNDLVYGGDGNDTLFGGLNDDQFYGGLGNDIYNTNSALDAVFETVGGAAGGVDLVNAYANFTLGANFEKLAMTGVGTVGTGNSLNNTITGQGNAETLSGLDGNDFIFGGAGNDTLRGGNGNDDLTGGAGADVLFGGANNDVFRFGLRSETPNGAGDRIRGESGVVAFQAAGATAGDVINLAAIDANEVSSGNQTFVFGTAQTIGRLWAATSGTNTVIRGNVNNTAGHDFEIIIEDGGVLASAYASGDFVL